jgi:hypothetical protein
LTYNDGSRVSQEALDSIFESLVVLSGGYSMAGTVRGAYRMGDGSKQTDVLEQVWIAYEEGFSRRCGNWSGGSARCLARR